MSHDLAIAKLFEDFDSMADPVIDTVIATGNKDDHATMASGLSIRLVRWCLGDGLPEDEAKLVATGLVVELNTLKRNLRGTPRQ